VELRGLEPLTSSMPWWPDKVWRRAASRDRVHTRPCAAPFHASRKLHSAPQFEPTMAKSTRPFSARKLSSRTSGHLSGWSSCLGWSAASRQVSSCGCECAAMGSETSSPQAAGIRECVCRARAATTSGASFVHMHAPGTHVNMSPVTAVAVSPTDLHHVGNSDVSSIGEFSDIRVGRTS
jgi:hypothetical protein